MTKLTPPVPVSPTSRQDRFAAHVTLRQLRYFIAVAETGKVSTAANMIGISASVVTEAIAELEGLSGKKLFTRKPRGLELTYDGHRFLAHCRRVLSAVAGASAALVRPDSEFEGELRLGATITVTGYFLAPLLSRFQQTFPGVKVKVFEAPRVDLEAGIRRGEIDVALMLTSNLTKSEEFLTHTLVHSLRRLWLPPGHPLLRPEVVTLADVAAQPYVQLQIDDAEASTSAYWRAHGLQPDIVFRTHSVEAIRSFISNRQGVTILSDMMYRPWSLEGERIEVREVAAKIPTLDTGLAWSRKREASPATRLLIDFCRIEYESGRLEQRRNMPIEHD